MPLHPPQIPPPTDYRYGPQPQRMLPAPQAHTSTSPNDNSDEDHRNPRKRFRNDRGHAIALEDLVIDAPIITTLDRPRPVELDAGLMRELTNRAFHLLPRIHAGSQLQQSSLHIAIRPGLSSTSPRLRPI